MRPTNRPSASRRGWIIVAVCLGAIVLGVWSWPRNAVELNAQGYDVTIALYRACNQRSEEGIVEIERQLAEMDMSDRGADAAQFLITQIIQKAKAGQWHEASVACREALNDQLRPSSAP